MNIFNKLAPILSLLLGLIFSVLIWDYIELPYDNTNNIVGQYSLNKFNPLNDTIRGIGFISIPLLIYLVTFLRFNKIKINFSFSKNYDTEDNNQHINYLILIFIFFSILEFYNLDYSNFISNLDTHHEGTNLTAQFNFFNKDGYWSKTFYDYGFLGNNIGVLAKYIFNNYSIGIQRFTLVFLILINKIFLILICGQLIKNYNFKTNKNFFFLIFTLSTLTLADFNENVTPFHPKMFLFLIFTFLIFKIINSKKKFSILYILVGFFSMISILFYYDIGTYINALIIITLTYLFLSNKFLKALQIMMGIFVSWLIFITIIPENELNEFISQYYIIINTSDYLLGIEYPKPFSENSTRYTKALLLIVCSGVLLINFIFSNKQKGNLIAKFYLFYLFVSSIIFFKSGLMRSDTPHIKYTSGIYTLILFFFISYFVTDFIHKFKFSKKINFFFEEKTYLLSITILVSFFFFFKDNFINLNNLVNSNKNFLMLTKVKDEQFLDNDYYKFLNEFKKLVKDEKCIQQFTDDNAIPYLVGKPTCTKYYNNAHIIQNWTEENFIEELKNSSPNYIVYSSRVNWFKTRNNAPNADKFILNKYFFYKDLSPWKIYKKR